MERKKYTCKFCDWIWLSDKNPKTCPRCCNAINKKPVIKKQNANTNPK